jgi:hypothetical protein
MKKELLITSVVLSVAIGLFSCSKQSNSSSSSDTYIKAIVYNGNIMTVNCFPLSDGNNLVLGKNPLNNTPGLMVKFSLNGSILWQKRASTANVFLAKAFPLSAGGFLTAGFDATPADNNLNLITYDNNGDSLSSAVINPGGVYNYPINIIQLTNGGYACAGSVLDDNGFPLPFLMITDNAFNELYYKIYYPITGEHKYCVTGLSQSPDGALNLTGFVNINNQDNAFLLCAYSYAVQKFFEYFTNNNLFETPDCLGTGSNGNFILPFATSNINGDNGALVNYYGTAPQFVAGSIGIRSVDTSGNTLNSVQYGGYPNGGLISSISNTSDGGFILSGTVNQFNQLNITYSSTQIYALKLDANLNLQWSSTYDTYYPSFGVAAFQTTDGGYIIAGYHFASGKTSTMVIIKTDVNGNVN